MEDDEDHQREITGEGTMKQVSKSNEDEDGILEGAEHEWDRKRKPEEFSRDIDRRKEETRNGFGAGDVVPADALETVEGSGMAEKDRKKVSGLRGGYGMLVLPNGRVMKLREKSLQKLGLMMNEGDDIRMGSAWGTVRQFRNNSNSEGIETTSNEIPRREKLGYRSSRGEENTAGIPFEEKVVSLEGYAINKGRRSDRRGVGMARDSAANVTSQDDANGTNTKIPVNRVNSLMQWTGSLKAKSFATFKSAPLNETNGSPSSIRRPLIIGAAAKVRSRLMRIRG